MASKEPEKEPVNPGKAALDAAKKEMIADLAEMLGLNKNLVTQQEKQLGKLRTIGVVLASNVALGANQLNAQKRAIELTSKQLGGYKQLANNISMHGVLAEKLIRIQTRSLDQTEEQARATRESKDLQEQMASTSSDLQSSLVDQMRAQVQLSNDIQLKRVMITTGLKGEFAEHAKLLSIAKTQQRLAQEQIIASDQASGKEKATAEKKLQRLERSYQWQVELLKKKQQDQKLLDKELSYYEKTAKLLEEAHHSHNEYKKSWKEAKGIMQSIATDPSLNKTIFGGLLVKKTIHEAEHLAKEFGEIRKTGESVGQSFHTLGQIMSANVLLGQDNVGAIEGMQDRIGDLNSITTKNVKSAAALAQAWGLSAREAGELVGSMAQLPGVTQDAAVHMTQMTGRLASSAGVKPGVVLKGMAQNTEAIAKFSAKGGESFARAAVGAAKMGVEVNSIVSATEGLLDFENSINKQMEASVLLGREINLDKARALALNGDIAGATAEMLRNVGGEVEFNRMNLIQKKALADSMNMSVSDLGKMVKNQDKFTDAQRIALEQGTSLQEVLAMGVGTAEKLSGALTLENFTMLFTGINAAKGTFSSMKDAFGAAKGTTGLWNKMLAAGKGFIGFDSKLAKGAKAVAGKVVGRVIPTAKSVVSDKSKTLAKDGAKKVAKTVGADKTKDLASKIKVDKTKGDVRKVTKTVGVDKTKDLAKSVGVDKSKNLAKDSTRSAVKSVGVDKTKDLAKDSTRKAVKSVGIDKTKAFAKEVKVDKPKDLIKGNATKASKSTTSNVVGDSSKKLKQSAKQASEGGQSVGKKGMFAGFKQNMTNLADGLKQLGSTKVLGGIFNLALAGPALLAAIPSLPFLVVFGKVSLPKLAINFKGLSEGLTSMGTGKVTAGSANMALAGVGLVAGLLALPFLTVFGVLPLAKLESNFRGLSAGIGSLANGKVVLGAAVLTAIAAASAVALVGIPFLGVIALTGSLIGLGLKGLALGLASLANPAAAIGVALLSALGLAIGASMYMLGSGIKAASEGMSRIGESLGKLPLDQMLLMPVAFGGLALGIMGLASASVVAAPGLFLISAGMLALTPSLLLVNSLAQSGGLSKLSSDLTGLARTGPELMGVGLALASIATGLGMVNIAGIAAIPVLGALTALAAIAPSLAGLNVSSTNNSDSVDSQSTGKMDSLLHKVDKLISINTSKEEQGIGTLSDKLDQLIAIASKGGVINMDGQKVGTIIRQGVNSSNIR